MNNLKIEVSNILIFSEDRKYRVLYVSNENVYTIRMDIEHFEIQLFNAKSLLHEIIDNNVNLIEDNNLKILDISSFSEKMKRKYEVSLDIVNKVAKEYGPTFIDIDSKKNKDIYNTLAKTHSVSTQKIRRIIRKWLQSGMNNYVLVNYRRKNLNYNYKHKPGRKTASGIKKGIPVNDEIKAYFNEAINEYRKSRQLSFRQAYNHMILDHFSIYDSVNKEYVPYAVSQRPTYEQFYNYAHKTLSKDEVYIIKNSKNEYRNNHRPLLSDSLKDAAGPGDIIEMDEVELDISLVSEFNPSQVVGRPILYAMTDVYTRMIVAINITFDNNSVNGFTGCLRNLAMNKKEFCKNYGIELNSDDIWRSNFIPNNIRVDRGSEYNSDKVQQICREHNITLLKVTGGMGSLKGVVEQLFHQIHSNQNNIVENSGLITKRHDSNHHAKATFNLSTITQMIIHQVLHHNNKLMKDYPATKDMTINKVHKTPEEIWNYGVKKYGNPRPISNTLNFIYSLLASANAKISRKGIKFKGLYYLPDPNDEQTSRKISSIMNKSEPFICAYDLSSVNYLYYIIDNQLYRAYLNPDKHGNIDYIGFSFEQYNHIKSIDKQLYEESKETQLKKDINLNHKLETIAASMTKEKNLSTANIREARKEEKMLNHIINNNSDLLFTDNDLNNYLSLEDDDSDIVDNDYEIIENKGSTKEEMEEDAKKAILKFMEDSWR